MLNNYLEFTDMFDILNNVPIYALKRIKKKIKEGVVIYLIKNSF